MRRIAALIPQPADARTALAMQRLFYEQSLFSLVSAVLMLVLQSAYAIGRVPTVVLGGWLAGAALLLLVRWRWRRQRLALDDAAAAQQRGLWQRRALVGSGLTGLMWAAALWMNFRADEPASQMFCAMLVCITCVASISVMAPLPAAFWALLWPQALVLVPQFLLMAADGRWAGLYYAVLALAGTLMGLALVRRHARLLHDSHALRFEREALLGRLQAAVDARSRFLAAASHDLRQPLHALGLLIDQVQTDLHHGRRAAATAAQAQRMVLTLDRLVGALLDLSRLDSGAVPLQRQPLALAALFDRLADEFTPVAEARGLQWRVRPSTAWVDSDPVQLERILRNLLGNALRYTRQGGVLMAARRHCGGVRLGVWDTGPGIAPEHQQHVFDEFVQLHNPGRDREQGLGLGLAIVQRLARLLGHPLGLRSRPGRGSCFHLDLPTCAPPVQAQPGPAADAMPGPTAGAGGVVALVEDDDAVRDATAALLQQWGWQVRAAADAGSVLAQLQAEQLRPDRVVSDWRLAQGDGLQAVAALRQQAGLALPALLLSGEALDGLDPAQLQDQGITLARKPLPPRQLLAWLSAPGWLADRPACAPPGPPGPGSSPAAPGRW